MTGASLDLLAAGLEEDRLRVVPLERSSRYFDVLSYKRSLL